jgi:hypothetical protein
LFGPAASSEEFYSTRQCVTELGVTGTFTEENYRTVLVQVQWTLRCKEVRITNNCQNPYKKNQRDALFLKFIFGIERYIFRTDFLSIIRSLVLYTQ